MLTLDRIMNESIWVVKMNWGRMSGTYKEMEPYVGDEECRDFDISAKQPTAELQEFWDELDEYIHTHKEFITAQKFYPIYVERHKPSRVWTEDEIKNLVQTNDKVLYGALKKLYAEQTADEQESGDTHHVNGAGFNGADAPILSSFAEFLNRTGFLTPKQKVIARRKLVKYNKQLTRLANC